MNDEADREHRSDQIARTFTLLTVKLEDATALAAEGQGKRRKEELERLSEQIAGLAEEIATVAGALGVLMDCRRAGLTGDEFRGRGVGEGG